MKKTVLVFCAHPDDETLGAGGFIKQLTRKGYNVVTIIFSLGEQGAIFMSKDYLIPKRIKEARRVSKILGAKSLFLSLKDMNLINEVKNPRVQRTIKRLIDYYNPKLILFHSKDDRLYKDHLGVYNVVSKVCDEINYNNAYTFNIWNPVSLSEVRNDAMVINIRKTLRIKLKALMEFKTQKTSMYQLIPVVIIKAFIYGITHKYRFAEVFYKYN